LYEQGRTKAIPQIPGSNNPALVSTMIAYKTVSGKWTRIEAPIQKIHDWMKSYSKNYGDVLDLAADCASDLELWDMDGSIPTEISDLAETYFEKHSNA
jgi:hypothetical protein